MGINVHRSALISLSITTLLAPTAVTAADWSDTWMGYRTGGGYREPSNPNNIRKHILSVSHASSYRFGSNFFTMDYLSSDDNDPAHSGDNGATEFYFAYRHQLHWGKITGTPARFGPIRDMGLTAGFDLETKNSTFSPSKRMVVVGPTFKFDVPGFLDVSVVYAQEWGECGIPPCKEPGNHTDVTFDPFPRIEVAWNIPFEVRNVPLKFQGWSFYNGKKGKDYLNVETEAEHLIRPSLMVDVGQMLLKSKNTLWMGMGYEYRRNTYGNHGKTGVNTNTPTFNLEWHF